MQKSPHEGTAPRIKALRESLGMNQTEFARALGTRPSTVSKWEAGSNRPSPDIFVRIAKLADGPEKLFFLEEAGLPVAYLDGVPMLAELREASTQVIAKSLSGAGTTFVPVRRDPEVARIDLLDNSIELGDPNAVVARALTFPAQWFPDDALVQAVKLSNNISPFMVGSVVALVDVSRRDPHNLLGCIVAARTPSGVEPMTLRKDGSTYLLVPLQESAKRPVRVLRMTGDWSIIGKVLKWIGDAPGAGK